MSNDASAPTPRGTYRVDDRSQVAFRAAVDLWVGIALGELIATAKTYGAVITYGELAGRVQEVSGIQTTKLLAYWIGGVLEKVAEEAVRAGEPPLTALCVHQDGTIGAGYANAPKSTGDSPGTDIEHYAAEHRLLCYQKYARDLPADGGRPELTTAESNRRRWARTQAKQTESPRLCQSCFTTLPTSGKCDYCDQT